MYMIQESFKYELKQNTDLQAYIYSDSSINTDQSYTCKSKTELTDTDTEFTIQYEFSGIYIDFIREESDYLKYRYIKYTDTDNNVKYIRIDEYNNTTGEVVINEPFGEVVDTSKEFSVVVLDSLYVSLNSPATVGGQTKFSRENARLDMKLQTKRDGSRKKIYGFMQAIKDTINQQASLPLYEDETFTTVQSYAKPTRSVRFNETLNSGEQYMEFFGTVNMEYYYEY